MYAGYEKGVRLRKIIRNAIGLWPSVVVADVAYIFVRPYFHYILLLNDIEVGIAATVAHFLAFAVYNCIATFSKSMIDYARSRRP
jgi:hypothetical protein